MVAFGSITVFTVVIQALVALGNSRENTEELLHDKAATLLDSIESRVHATLRPVSAQGQAIARLTNDNGLEADDPRVLAFAVGTLTATQQISSMTIVQPGVGVTKFARVNKGVETTRRAINADSRALLERAAAKRRAFWGVPKVVAGTVILDHYSPAYDVNGELVGLLIQRVSGGAIARAIATLASTSERQTPFILYGREHVLAHPLLINGNLQLPTDRDELPALAGFADAILERVWDRDEIRLVKLQLTPGDVIKGISFGDRAFLFVVRTIKTYGEEPWIVGAYLDGSRTKTQVQRVAATIIVGVIMVILAISGAIFIGSRLSQPVTRLAQAAMLIREERIDEVVALPPTRVRELDEASESFNAMVLGIRERDVIRDLFGKFVPTSVAAAMLRSPNGMQPQSAEATILFVDMAGFTELTQRIDASAIVGLLNEYFSDLVSCIEAQGGIVTQFQGDAVLAVFNVPLAVPNHQAHAVNAARAILKTVNKSRYRGEHLACRIGIATGAVVAGNVGAEGRMNYTVHGDAVNLASRLEQLNKDYGTNILIAEATVAGVPGESFRSVATVEIRGRKFTTALYTLAE